MTVIVEQYVQREEKQEKPRKKQHGLTVFIAGAILAILIYLVSIFCENMSKQRKKSKERAANLQEMITVKPIPGDD